MVLTPEQMATMDKITGYNSVRKSAAGIKLSEDDIRRMDEITGLARVNETPDLRTQIINKDPLKAKQIEAKGAITPYEAAKNEARAYYGLAAFDGTYDNVLPDRKPNEMNAAGQAVSSFMDDHIPKVKSALKKINNKLNSIYDADEALKNPPVYSGVRGDVSSFEKERRAANKVPVQMTPEKEIDTLKKIGFLEGVKNTVFSGTLIGQSVEGIEDKQLRCIAEKIRNGEGIYQRELDFLNKTVDKEQEKIIRGYTTGGQIGEAVGYSLGFTADILIGSALFGAIGGSALTAKTGINTYKALRGAGVGKNLARAGAKTTAWGIKSLGGAGAATAINSPLRGFAGYQSRRLNDEMTLTETGLVTFQESEESPAKAFFKSLGSLYISYFTEMGGGEALGAVAGAVAKPFGKMGGTVINKLIAKNPNLGKFLTKTTEELSKRYEQLRGLPVLGRTADWIKDTAHFDGFLEEMGEEALEDVLNLTFGINKEEKNLENYINAAFKSPDEWAVISGSILIQGAGLSAAGYVLGNRMAQSKADPETILNVLNNTTEEQKRSLINGLIQQGALDFEIPKSDNVLSNIKNRYYEQNINAGMDEAEALQSAEFITKLIGVSAKNWNMNTEDTEKIFGINIQSMTDAQAIEQMNADRQKILQQNTTYQNIDTAEENTLYQSAYHGTPHKFDSFSTEHIGSGEGAQAHGWGLYFAGNKDVSEGYRKGLTNDIKYQGKPKNETILKDLSSLSTRFLIHGEGKKSAINNIKRLLKTYAESVEDWQKKYQDDLKAGKQEQADFDKRQLEYSENEIKIAKKDLEILNQVDEKDIEHGGQLYEVDIPEDDVLLDEDKPFSKQPAFVKKALRKLFKDKGVNFTEYIKSTYTNGDPDGGALYSEVRGFFPQEENKSKAASKLLNKYGIKGITYDGYEDGRCYVIFDDKAVDVLKTYYQSAGNMSNKIDNVVDLSNEFDKTPTLDEVKAYINEVIEQGTKFATLSPDWFVDIRKGARTKKKILNGGNYKGLDKAENARHNKYLMSLEKLLSKAEYAGEKENTKKDKKPNVAKYHYFKTNVKIGGKVYQLIFDTEEYINENPPTARHAKRALKPLSEDTTIITDNKENVKRAGKKSTAAPAQTVHLYNIKEIKKPRVYYQENNQIETSRGFTYERYNFDGTAKENLIVLLQGKADKSTLLHEVAHVYLNVLNQVARTNDKAKDQLIKVNKFLKYNGKEYTREQHEKFANYFVAYVKTGKAPSYGLKKVFENFKKWLNDLYSEMQITDGIEISQEAKEVFDELLGDMTLEAHKQKSDDIRKKARENALLRFYEEESKKHNVPQNQLTNRQKRYRDTAYDILWYALSNSKEEVSDGYRTYKKPPIKDKHQLYMLLGSNSIKGKGRANQAEKLAEFLGEIDDVFSGGNGFLPEWGEFFSDPGVSYDNQESGADAELALQALDVIQNKKYLYDNEYEELSNNDVKLAELELDYILDRYQECKTEDEKTDVVVAFFDWADNQHPYLQEEFISRWETKTNEVDRYNSLTRFEQAKEDLKIQAAALRGYGDYPSQFAEYARKILKRLDFMSESDKAKIFDKLKNFNSFREIERNLDDVIDYAQTLQDMTDRHLLAEDIIREVKQTIHEWKGGIKRTKYTYPANKLFEKLRKINNLTQKEAQNLYDAQVNEEYVPDYTADKVNDESFYETLEKMFIKFKANGYYYNSTEFLTILLDKIQSAKFSAKVARDEMDFERRIEQINLIDECAKAVDHHKFNDNKNKLVKIAQDLNAHIMNFNGALTTVFDDKIKNIFSLDYLYAKKDGAVGRDRRIVLDKLKKVYGFKTDIQLYSKVIDMTKPEHKIKQRYTPDIESGSIHTSDIADKESGRTKATVQQIMPENSDRQQWAPEEITLSKMEILYYYIQSKNDISYTILTHMGDETTPPKGQFDKFEFDEMIGTLTPQEKLMGDILQMAAEKYYNGLNAYHIKRYHTELGKVNCYFPRKTETEDPRMLEIFNDYVFLNGTDSSQKHRTAYAGVRIKPANALAVLFDHIEKANTIIIMGEQLDLMNRVFNNSNLKKKVETVFGENVMQSFYEHVTANLFGGQSVIRSLQEAFFGKLANNAVKTQIFFRPQIGLKQLLSFMNYGKGDKYVSAGEWLQAFTKQTLTPKEWKKNIEFMFENEYLRDRFCRGGSTDALKRQLETKIFSKLSLLDEFWSIPVRYGDIGAIILGGKPYIDVLLNKGYSKEQAFKIFIETTVNDQQSSIPSTLSNAQRNAKRHPFSTFIFAYQNTPYQYLRSAYTPIVQALQNPTKENTLRAGKMLFIYGWLFPALFNMASTLSVFSLIGGDDEQIKKDMGYAFLGLFGMLPIIGDLTKAVIYGLAGEGYSAGADYFKTASQKLYKLTNHIQEDKVTLEDVFGAVTVLAEPTTGVPVGAILNSAGGIYDTAQGSVAKGALRLGGYTENRAKKILGEN